jgi:Na+/H+ antiporter NhaD/arsenite permease-like protein
MTIVEVIDSYDGFQFIVRLLRVKSLWTFLTIVVFLSFFLSAVIDNLTTTIVMASIFQKVVPRENRSARLLGISLIVLAANSGGAWSPLGDVTTTMLWIKQRITEVNIIKRTFLPSLVSILVPMLVVGRLLRGTALKQVAERETIVPARVSRLVFVFGIGGILSVPLLKVFLHIPPFAAMLGAMGLVWLLTEILYRRLRKNLYRRPGVVSCGERAGKNRHAKPPVFLRDFAGSGSSIRSGAAKGFGRPFDKALSATSARLHGWDGPGDVPDGDFIGDYR